MWYNSQAVKRSGNASETNGGIAQLARALGSYPKGRGFKSNFRYHDNLGCHAWPGGQAAKTPPFHGGNTGSIPVRVTRKEKTGTQVSVFSFFGNIRTEQGIEESGNE